VKPKCNLKPAYLSRAFSSKEAGSLNTFDTSCFFTEKLLNKIILWETIYFRKATLLLFIRGLSCPCSVQTSVTQKYLKLIIPGFPDNLLSVSCGDTCFKKKNRSSVGLEIRPQSAYTPLGPSCPLQTILLNDLVGYDSPLDIVYIMVF
jgi:hypothetical protein